MTRTTTFHILSDTTSVDPEIPLRAALAACDVPEPTIVRYPQVQAKEGVATAYESAHETNGIVVHALFDSALRQSAHLLERELHVHSIDLIGPIVVGLIDLLEIPRSAKPDFFRHLDEDYFRRIEAIEFAVAHDDGLRPQDLGRAEIVLIGVSRTSKTPLSMYLASHGWFVANVPLVLDVDPPQTLFEVDPRKVFGLTIRPERLAMLRRVRLTRLGISGPERYADLEYVRNDLRHAHEVFQRGQTWRLIDVTGKAIEETANEVIQLLHDSSEGAGSG
jgi:hypothetical protein